MNKYQLIVITGNGVEHYTVFAEHFHTRDGSGYYAFFAGGQIVSCWPIERTIIRSIEDAEQ